MLRNRSDPPALFTFGATTTCTADPDTRRGKVRRRRWHTTSLSRGRVAPPPPPPLLPPLPSICRTHRSTITSSVVLAVAKGSPEAGRIRGVPAKGIDHVHGHHSTLCLSSPPHHLCLPYLPYFPLLHVAAAPTARPPPGGVLPYLGTALEQGLSPKPRGLPTPRWGWSWAWREPKRRRWSPPPQLRSNIYV